MPSATTADEGGNSVDLVPQVRSSTGEREGEVSSGSVESALRLFVSLSFLSGG